MRGICLLALVALLSGCQAIKIATTKKIDPEGNGEGYALYIIRPDNIRDVKILGGSEYRTRVYKACGFDEDEGVPKSLDMAIWGPVAAKLIFDLGADKLASYVDGVKKSSSAVYRTRLHTKVSDFDNAQCIAVVRTPKDNVSGYDSLVVLKFYKTDIDDEVVKLRPVFAWARNSVALTKCEGDCNSENAAKEGDIAISAAVVISGVSRGSTSVMQIRQFAVGTVSFPKVPLGGNGVFITEPLAEDKSLLDAATDSEIMPATYVGKNLQISVAITETGNVLGDFDRAAAEIAAIKGALGPAVEAQVTERYKDED